MFKHLLKREGKLGANMSSVDILILHVQAAVLLCTDHSSVVVVDIQYTIFGSFKVCATIIGASTSIRTIRHSIGLSNHNKNHACRKKGPSFFFLNVENHLSIQPALKKITFPPFSDLSFVEATRSSRLKPEGDHPTTPVTGIRCGTHGSLGSRLRSVVRVLRKWRRKNSYGSKIPWQCGTSTLNNLWSVDMYQVYHHF